MRITDNGMPIRRPDNRPSWVVLVTLAVMTALSLIVALVVINATDASGKDQCRERGGTVEQVNGGRGGWVCIGDH